MSTNWKTSSLGEVLEKIQNGVNCKQARAGSGYKISRIETIATGSFDLSRVGYANLSSEQQSKYKLKNSDILFSHINSPPHVGKSAIYRETESLFHGINLLLLRTKEMLAPDYLALYLKWLHGTGFWAKTCKKSVNQASVNQQDIKIVKIRFPESISEQKRIVAILDEAFAAIERAKEIAQKNIANARELFEAKLEKIFIDGGPEWAERKLLEIGETVTGTTPKKFHDFQETTDISFVKPGDFLQNGLIRKETEFLSEKQLPLVRLVPPKSTLMVCIGATIGKAGYSDRALATNQQINSITPRQGFDHQFLYFAFITRSFQRSVIANSGQATLPIINKTRWSNLSVSAPGIDQQRRVVEYLTELQNGKDYVVILAFKKMVQLDCLKQFILHKAFTGQLTAKSPELEAIP